MALSLSGPSANAVPTQLLEDALKDFESVLSDSQRQELHQIKNLPDTDAVIVFTAELDARNVNRKGRSVASNLFSVLQSVRDFSTIVGTFVSAHPEIAALVWGSVQLTTRVLTNFVSYYETASKLFIELGRMCPRFAEYRGLYPASMKLKAALCDFHASIIRFCKHLVEVLQRHWVQQALHSLWESFDQEFGSDRDEIRTLSKNVKCEIDLAKTKAAHRDQQLQETYRKKAEESRSIVARFLQRTDDNMENMKHQQLQREEQRAWDRRQHLLDELSTHDYLTPLKQSRRKRHAGTTEWVFQTAQYATWFDGTGPPLLWCTGKIGSGKTVLSASVVDHILVDKKTPDTLVAFYFVRFDDEKSLLADTAVRSIARQLLHLESLLGDEEAKLKHAVHPGAAPFQLLEILYARIKQLERCFIIIDGIDEFEKQERTALLGMLHGIVSQTSNTRLFLAGRESSSDEIRSKFLSLQKISMENSSLWSDMELYIHDQIQERIESKELVVENQELIADIKTALLTGADGMFLWISFLLDEICSQHCDEDIRSTISDLPRDLTEVFNRALHRIVSRRNEKIAQKAFQWIGGMKRPPRIDELREIILVQICQPYSMPERKCNDIQRIASWCENLVTVDEELGLVQFGHHSVRTFLLRESDDANLQNFHFKPEEAIHYIGEICVTYLNFNDFKTTLARKAKPLPPIDPAEIPGKVFQSRALNILKKTARPQSVAAAAGVSETISSFARNGTRTEMNQLNMDHPFLAYAREYWTFHTSRFQREKSRTWALFERMVLNGHQLANTPWESEATIFEWAVSCRHIALLGVLIKSRPCSEDEKQLLGKLPIDVGDEMQLNMILNAKVFHDSWARPTLVAAIESRNEDLVDKLLGAGIIEVLTDMSQYDVLLSAARYDYGCVAGKLLRLGAYANYHFNDSGYSNVSNREGFTALHSVFKHRDKDMVDKLLTAGVNANAYNSDGFTALHSAVKHGYKDMVDKLLTAGADVNAYNSDGFTALHSAVKHGYKDMVDKLLTAGADVNAYNSDGFTTLHSTVKHGYKDMVDKLLTAGADVNAYNSDGFTTLQFAIKRGDKDQVDRLLAARADANVFSREDFTALHSAVKHKDKDMVDKLLTAGANVNTPNYDGFTALQSAIKCGDKDIVDKLLTAGADVNALSWDGYTSLYYAIKHKNKDLVDRLLVAGVDANVFSREDFTALQYAIERGDKDMVDELLGARA